MWETLAAGRERRRTCLPFHLGFGTFWGGWYLEAVERKLVLVKLSPFALNCLVVYIASGGARVERESGVRVTGRETGVLCAAPRRRVLFTSHGHWM